MDKRFIVATIGAIAVIVAAIIQKPNKELLQQRQVSGTVDRGGTGIGTTQGGSVGVGTGGGVGVGTNLGTITIYSPKQAQPQLPRTNSRENSGMLKRQQNPPDSLQPHIPAINKTSLRGKITFADGVAEQFDTLQASGKSGPYVLETYNRDSSGLKQNNLDLRRVSQLTFGENARIGEAYYITLQIIYKGDGEENVLVALNDTLSIAKVDSLASYKELSKIERITFE